MNNLIKISTNDKNEQLVSARDLHEFLEIETPFRIWFPRMTEYGFLENEDFTPYNFVHPQNKQPTKDFVLKIDMAKELCMIQRSERGKQARQYFIQVEKAWNTPELIMARALQMSEQKILDYQKKYFAVRK